MYPPKGRVITSLIFTHFYSFLHLNQPQNTDPTPLPIRWETAMVFKAKKDDETFAMKVLSRSILRRKRVGRHGSAYDSVMGEIAVMKLLDHTHLVRLFEVIDDPDEVRLLPARRGLARLARAAVLSAESCTLRD